MVGILSAFGLDNDQFVKYPALYQAWAIIAPLLYLLMAYILISKAEYISTLVVKKDDNSRINNPNYYPLHSQLSFWITLLGLYFIITSASQVAKNVISYPLHLGDSFIMSLFASQGLILFAGLYMTFRSKKVEAFIQKKSK